MVAGQRRQEERVSVTALMIVALAMPAEAPAPFDPGPRVGEPLPKLEARDQDGRIRSFETLKGPNGLVLLFFRSADW
jgi:hypothetical protein